MEKKDWKKNGSEEEKRASGKKMKMCRTQFSGIQKQERKLREFGSEGTRRRHVRQPMGKRKRREGERGEREGVEGEEDGGGRRRG